MPPDTLVLAPGLAPPEKTPVGKKSMMDEAHYRSSSRKQKKIWIDLDNSPHVPFFLPIIAELEKRGYKILLSARNIYQVCELLELHHLSCKVFGRHWGKNRALKTLGTCIRATQLFMLALRERPDLALSHGSRAQLLTGSVLRIPVLTMYDYEYVAKTWFLHENWALSPSYIPDSSDPDVKKRNLKYPGLKEDVYISQLKPDPLVKSQLGLGETDLVVTVRPPATEAHYHNPEAEVLFDAALNFLLGRPDISIILLPRNQRQEQALRKQWGEWIAKRRIVIPDRVVDGLNLIWFSDFVISGGGTMNREAAALGVPVYSIFRGKIGAVDRSLAEEGRLTLIENVEEIRTKIVLARRNRPASPENGNRPALSSIVHNIIAIVEGKCPATHHSER